MRKSKIGVEYEEFESSKQLVVKTKVPEKYVLLDLENLHIYQGNPDSEGFSWKRLDAETLAKIKDVFSSIQN